MNKFQQGERLRRMRDYAPSAHLATTEGSSDEGGAANIIFTPVSAVEGG